MRKTKFKISNFTILLILFINSISLCHSEPIQIFLDSLSEGACGVPLKIKIFALDEIGEIDKTFNGDKKVTIKVKELNGVFDNSYSIKPEIINFKEGQGVFYIEDSEPETLEVKVSVKDINFDGFIDLSFSDKDVVKPEIKSVKVESENMIVIEFSEPIEEESALNEDNYLAVTNKQQVHPSRIQYRKDSVVLIFSENSDEDEEGYIEINNLKDLSGNQIEPGSKTPDIKVDCGCEDKDTIL